MHIFTKSETEAVTKYYSEILIGKPITPPGNSNPFLVTSLETTKVENGYVVKCISNSSGRIIFGSLEKVILHLDVLPLEEFLSNPNQ